MKNWTVFIQTSTSSVSSCVIESIQAAAAKLILVCPQVRIGWRYVERLSSHTIYVYCRFQILVVFRSTLFGPCPSLLSAFDPILSKIFPNIQWKFYVKVPICKTQFLHQSFCHKGQKIWNSLPTAFCFSPVPLQIFYPVRDMWGHDLTRAHYIRTWVAEPFSKWVGTRWRQDYRKFLRFELAIVTSRALKYDVITYTPYERPNYTIFDKITPLRKRVGKPLEIQTFKSVGPGPPRKESWGC